MARIAEDLLLLLLDNTSARSRLDRTRLGRVLAAALVLDLAFQCRVRPAMPEDPVAPGELVALAGPMPLDPAVRPALAELTHGPITPAAAIAKIRRHAEDDVLDQLLRTGQIHQVGLTAHRLRRNTYAWPVKNRDRVNSLRGAVSAALSGSTAPTRLPRPSSACSTGSVTSVRQWTLPTTVCAGPPKSQVAVGRTTRTSPRSTSP